MTPHTLLRNQFWNLIGSAKEVWDGAVGLRLIEKIDERWFVVAIPIGSTMPTVVAETDLIEMIEERELVLAERDPFEPLLNELAESEKAVAEQERRWEVLRDVLVKSPDSLLTRSSRGRMIRALADDTGYSRDTLLRWIRQYWERGQTPQALLSGHGRKGGAGKRRVSGEEKRGRQSRLRKLDGESRGVNITPAMRKLIEDGAEQFIEEKRLSYPKAYKKTLRKYFSDVVFHRGGEERRVRDQRPSLGQFRYYAKAHLESRGVKSVQKRMGKKDFSRDGRTTLGSLRAQIRYPGQRLEIDATPVDVHLVSAQARRQVIGRAILYLVRDVFSGLIVGFYVGLENPSWEGMRQALWNAFDSKRSVCDRLGVPFREQEWPCTGIGDVLVGDRGELVSQHADYLVSELLLQVTNAPGYRPDLKPFVERIFATMNQLGFHELPGKVEKRRRGKRDPREFACLTLEEFEKILLLTILEHNMASRPENLEDIPPSYPAHERGGPTPRELWDWGVQYATGAPRTVDRETLRRALWIRDSATVSAKGIRVKKLTYTPEALLDPDSRVTDPLAMWFVRRNSTRPKRVKVLRNPRDVGEIYFMRGKGAPLERAILRDELDHLAGWSLREVQTYEDLRLASEEPKRKKDLDVAVTIDAKREQVVAESRAQQALENPGVRSSSTKRIREARNEERSRIERPAEPLPTYTDEDLDPEPERAGPDPEDYIPAPSYLDVLD